MNENSIRRLQNKLRKKKSPASKTGSIGIQPYKRKRALYRAIGRKEFSALLLIAKILRG